MSLFALGELVELKQRLQYLIYICVNFIIVQGLAECNYFGKNYVVIIQKIKFISTDSKSDLQYF